MMIVITICCAFIFLQGLISVSSFKERINSRPSLNFQRWLVNSHAVQSDPIDVSSQLHRASFRMFAMKKRKSEAVQYLQYQRLSKGLEQLICEALELGLEDEDLGKLVDVKKSRKDKSAYVQKFSGGSNNTEDGIGGQIEPLVYANTLAQYTLPLSIDNNLPYIQRSIDSIWLNITHWPEKVSQNVLNYNAKKASLELHYDYLSSNSLNTIEAPPFIKKDKNRDHYLRVWYLAALKWGLLTEKLELLHHVLSTFDVHSYATSYYKQQSSPDIDSLHEIQPNSWNLSNSPSDMVEDSDETSSSSKSLSALQNTLSPNLMTLIEKYKDFYDEMIDRIQNEVRLFVDKARSIGNSTLSFYTLPVNRHVQNNSLDHTNYNILFHNNISQHLAMNNHLSVYYDHIIFASPTGGFLPPTLAYNESYSRTRILDDVLVKSLFKLCQSHVARVIAIGDVHGCVLETVDLIRNVTYHPGDVLLFLGDLVAKGPHSSLVVQLCMDTQAIAVRGNHDQGVIYEGFVLSNKLSNQGSGEHIRIAKHLTYDQYHYLSKLPYYIASEDLGSLFVHAGFDMNLDLEKQSSWAMLTMRHLKSGKKTRKIMESMKKNPQMWIREPSSEEYEEGDDEKSNDSNRPRWGEFWPGPLKVYYGHDSQGGLKIYQNAVCLDSGCVYGSNVTAIILPEERIVTYKARRQYAKRAKNN